MRRYSWLEVTSNDSKETLVPSLRSVSKSENCLSITFETMNSFLRIAMNPNRPRLIPSPVLLITCNSRRSFIWAVKLSMTDVETKNNVSISSQKMDLKPDLNLIYLIGRWFAEPKYTMRRNLSMLLISRSLWNIYKNL